MKIIKITLPGSIRSKKNSRRLITIKSKYGKPRLMSLPSSAYVKWEKAARANIAPQLVEQGVWMALVATTLHIKALVYYKGQRPDLSGAMESIGDCLEGIVFENDSQIESWDGTRLIHCLDRPRTEIEVEVL